MVSWLLIWLSVVVEGDVKLYSKALGSIPVKFRNVSGSFYCHWNKLTNLDGCPVYIGGDICFGFNLLSSLEGCCSKCGA